MSTAPRPLPNPPRVVSPPSRPWPNLPAATQAQVARLLADLLRRLTPSRQATESSRAERRERR